MWQPLSAYLPTPGTGTGPQTWKTTNTYIGKPQKKKFFLVDSPLRPRPGLVVKRTITSSKKNI